MRPVPVSERSAPPTYLARARAKNDSPRAAADMRLSSDSAQCRAPVEVCRPRGHEPALDGFICNETGGIEVVRGYGLFIEDWATCEHAFHTLSTQLRRLRRCLPCIVEWIGRLPVPA